MDNNLPRHIAIIPDGNRRYAQVHGISRIVGHRAGAERMHDVVDNLLQLGIEYLSVWGFSTDNWKREPQEVNSILELLGTWIIKDTPWLHANDVRLKHIGRFHQLPEKLQRIINDSVELTRNNRGMTLNLAFNYSGRTDIIDAVNRLIARGVPITDEEHFSRCLATDGAPDVDLVIRTAGEFRLSNFMLWQTAYSELYFTPALWPDFDTGELKKALDAYSERSRRFGGD